MIAGLIFGAYFVALVATILWPRFARWRTDYVVRHVYPDTQTLTVTNTIDRQVFTRYGYEEDKQMQTYAYAMAEREAIQYLVNELLKSGFVKKIKKPSFEDPWLDMIQYTLRVAKEKPGA